MIIGKVISQLVATQKNTKLGGAKLLLVQPLELDGTEKGETVLAVDAVDAGIGERVLVVQEGWSANYVFGVTEAPIDAAVIGVIDRIDLAEGDQPKAEPRA